MHETDLAEAQQRTIRKTIRLMARQYRRGRDLQFVLGHELPDYERNDCVCRWITAAIMRRLLRRLRAESSVAPIDGSGLSAMYVRACLRGEAAIYRVQTLERREMVRTRTIEPITNDLAETALTRDNGATRDRRTTGRITLVRRRYGSVALRALADTMSHFTVCLSSHRMWTARGNDREPCIPFRGNRKET